MSIASQLKIGLKEDGLIRDTHPEKIAEVVHEIAISTELDVIENECGKDRLILRVAGIALGKDLVSDFRATQFGKHTSHGDVGLGTNAI